MCEADFCLIIFMESVIYISISMDNLSDVIEKILQEACDRFRRMIASVFPPYIEILGVYRNKELVCIDPPYLLNRAVISPVPRIMDILCNITWSGEHNKNRFFRM
jgi:hypothetical protein